MTGTRRAGRGPQSRTETAPQQHRPARRRRPEGPDGRRRRPEGPDGTPRAPRRPDPPPMDIDESRIIAVGIAAWSVAFVVLVSFHSRLARHHDSWWIWTTVAGIGLGLWGWWLVRKRIAARLAARPKHHG